MTTMVPVASYSADSGTSQPTMHKRKAQVLKKTYAEYSSNQQLQILKLRLNFLRRCIPLKRPPPTLRIHGASALTDIEKLHAFSKLETETLKIAITVKVNEVRELTQKAKQENDTRQLDAQDLHSLKKHYDKKIGFYSHQNNSKWQSWPQKISELTKKATKQLTSKAKNFKKKQNRKERKTVKTQNELSNLDAL